MLTSRQRDDLNRAVADYLRQSGYSSAYSAFKEESSVTNDEDSKYNNILAKKWISVVRLQKKITDLQAQLTDVKDEVKEVSTLEGLQKRKDPTQWLPRPPAEHTLSSHRSPITCVLLHPAYPVMFSGSEDATIKVWDYEAGEYERTMKGHTDSVNCLAIEPSKAKYLASTSADMTVKIWDLESGDFDCIKTLKGHDHNVSSVNFINMEIICTSSRDRTIKLWNVTNGFCVKTVEDLHTDWIRKVLPSPCGKFIASCSNDQTVKVWSAEKFEEKADLREHEHVVEDIAWPNGNSIQYIEDPNSRSGQKNNNTTTDKQSSANGLTNGHANASLTNKNSTDSSSQLDNKNNSLSLQTSKYLVSCSRDKSIKFWDIQTSSVLFTLLGHDNWIRQIKFMPGGRYLLSCADDKSIRAWDIENRRCHKTIQDAQGHFVACIDVSRKGHKVVSGSIDTKIAVWSCR